MKMLIIEDEESIAMALEDDFSMEGFEVILAADGKTGLEKALDLTVDIILLDVVLPGMDGFEVCKTLRKKGCKTPIIMLTAKSQELDKILGLEFGADDYVTKPFSPRLLQARVNAVIRRSELRKTQDEDGIFEFGNVRVDLNKYEVIKRGVPVEFTALEFSLLRYFLKNHSKVASRDQILAAVWNSDVIVDTRTVDTHVLHLRKKIEDDPTNPKWIIGIRGVGYRFMLD